MLPSTLSKVFLWASLESLLCGFVKNKKLLLKRRTLKLLAFHFKTCYWWHFSTDKLHHTMMIPRENEAMPVTVKTSKFTMQWMRQVYPIGTKHLSFSFEDFHKILWIHSEGKLQMKMGCLWNWATLTLVQPVLTLPASDCFYLVLLGLTMSVFKPHQVCPLQWISQRSHFAMMTHRQT